MNQFRIFLIFVIFAAFVSGKEHKYPIKLCEEHRKMVANVSDLNVFRLVPECDENGNYKPLQCFRNIEFCACLDKTGKPLIHPSNKIKACDCIVQRENVKSKRLIGSFVPQCEEDGKYTKKQCHSSIGHCWCVDEYTGKNVTEPARGHVEC